jgi:hypothetical protein
VLLEQPGGKLGGEGEDALLALVEGDELTLRVVVEEQLEGGLGIGEPLPP